MENGAAMSSESAAARSRSCEVCGAATSDGQVSCQVCGAVLGAGVPTGSRAPVEPTNVMAMSAQPSNADSDQPGFTAAGLPTRRPRALASDEDALDAFTRSWEAASDDRLAADPSKLRPFAFTPPKPAPPPSRPATIDEFIRGTTLGRDTVSSAASSGSTVAPPPPPPAGPPVATPPEPAVFVPISRVPAEPRDPSPPEPPSPPDPVSPPEPPMPTPPGPPGPEPGPLPIPPPTPGPEPGPTPDPVPPIPTPDPVPTPRPTPPLPSPNPTPPGPVPPPPSMREPLPPGVYRGGYRSEPSTVVAQAPQSRIAAPGRPGGTVYGGQAGLPTSANPDAPLERSGSLTGNILARGRSVQSAQVERRQTRRRRMRTAAFFSLGLVIFMGAIAVIVYVLAGDFIRSFFDTITQF